MRRIALTDPTDLQHGGCAQRFVIDQAAFRFGFVIRYNEQLLAYENACPHRGTPLDWDDGVVFDDEQRYLVCATHGALFNPQDGLCVAGPCQGASLRPLLIQQDGQGYFVQVADNSAQEF